MHKHSLTLAAILSSATFSTASIAFASVPAAAATKVAPADEYFGPLAMSILGIKNALKDAAARLDADPSADEDAALRHIALVETSIHDWEAKYPGDNWLPRTLLALHRVYSRIHSEDGRRHATDTASWLMGKYAKTAEARTLRSEFDQAMTTGEPETR
jgi:hypothetical protein